MIRNTSYASYPAAKAERLRVKREAQEEADRAHALEMQAQQLAKEVGRQHSHTDALSYTYRITL